MEFTAQQIADFLKGIVVGDATAKAGNFSKIEEGTPGTLSFLANPKYERFIYQTEASIVLVNSDFLPTAPIKSTLIKVPDAYTSFASLLSLVKQAKAKKSGIDSSSFIAPTASVDEDCYVGAFAFIGENASIGKGCMIYPFAYIGDNATIGDNTVVNPHVTVYADCSIGSNCIIHAGVVIGADGFGFTNNDGEFRKIEHLGNVVIEDNVEIGANTTIDRAVMGSTIIRKGVKLDNLIQIAHNVEVGENTAMAAQVGIAGSTKVGSNCKLGGQVGLNGHITIGDSTQIAAQSGIMYSVEANSRLMGSPAVSIKKFLRSNILIDKLPDIYRTLNNLQKEIDELKKNK
ncbi:MAG: UDP-3-O-(3-hydroxymyristoyl)glucosamine N-acyltransferase [Tannerella sp.]|jgi:UDP-3-O-[3-hydroxymyristoyl] glucosamine N-acyltransferase|nr:UDP-3-O-(3-hydroxymyristoyl)glucosamine N-acyltransferase [Tannerella sp.]